jgi:hypothetical protein
VNETLEAIEEVLAAEDAEFAKNVWQIAWLELKEWLDDCRERQQTALSAWELLTKIKDLTPKEPPRNQEEEDYAVRFQVLEEEWINKTEFPLNSRIVFIRMTRLEKSVKDGEFQKNVPLF